MEFNQFDFDRRIHAGVRDEGFETPTPIQEEAIPLVLEGRDIIGVAQTGTGKTAAFALPILQRLTTGPLKQVRALILAPTRELAEQTHEVFTDLGARTKVRSVSIYGGVGKRPQIDALRRGAEVVVACPGRLLDLAGDRAIDLSHVEVLVLDEADRMCDMGFLPDIRRILRLLPEKRQTLFFSATMPKEIKYLADRILKDPVHVQIGEQAPVGTVSHRYYPVPQPLKKQLLLALLEQTPTGRVLIFTRTKYRARNLARDLNKANHRAIDLQGNMSQNKRQRAMDGFRDGKYDIMVATDIASRGIDVEEITHVINYDMPDTVDAYTHRIGRTGRAQQIGEAYSFVTRDDEKVARGVEIKLEQEIDRVLLKGFSYHYRPSDDSEARSSSSRPRGGRTRSSRRPRRSHSH